MSQQSCDQFQPHRWKKDVCADCMQPRSSHPSIPVAAKRSTKSTEQGAALQPRNKIQIKSGVDVIRWQQTRPNQASFIQTDSISSKPAAPAKPFSVTEQSSISSNTPVSTSQGRQGRPGRPRSRPPSQPPDVPTAEPKQQSNSNDSEELTDYVKSSVTNKSKSSSHYYHKYDVSGRTTTADPVADTTDEVQQPLAMPYTIVDVTLQRRTADQIVPPDLPSTPAPNSDKSHSSGLYEDVQLKATPDQSPAKHTDPSCSKIHDRIAALGDLDFSKHDVILSRLSGEKSLQIIDNKCDDNELSRESKARKSGGKSFLKKFLKFGGKENESQIIANDGQLLTENNEISPPSNKTVTNRTSPTSQTDNLDLSRESISADVEIESEFSSLAEVLELIKKEKSTDSTLR